MLNCVAIFTDHDQRMNQTLYIRIEFSTLMLSVEVNMQPV